MRMIAVGRVRRGAMSDLFQHYAARLRPGLEVIEITEARGSSAEIRRREAEALAAACAPRAWLVILDQDGTPVGSAEFARMLDGWRAQARDICFMIGGAEGLDRSITDRADFRLSLGALTWPHQLVRVMLAEQLYRAQTILSGHPYHRGARP